MDYPFFESTRPLQFSEIQMLKNQCEQERTQILTILMLSLENPRLAGYMLTGNRSMFLETDGSLAWLYSCPLLSSPLHVKNNCYDKIPIIYKRQIQFVDPITRQIYPNANTQNCTDRIKTLFQLDMQDKDSWFTLNPEPTHRGRPAIFGQEEISPFTKDAFDESQDAGMYTKGQRSIFWDNIAIKAASRIALVSSNTGLANWDSGLENFFLSSFWLHNPIVLDTPDKNTMSTKPSSIFTLP